MYFRYFVIRCLVIRSSPRSEIYTSTSCQMADRGVYEDTSIPTSICVREAVTTHNTQHLAPLTQEVVILTSDIDCRQTQQHVPRIRTVWTLRSCRTKGEEYVDIQLHWKDRHNSYRCVQVVLIPEGPSCIDATPANHYGKLRHMIKETANLAQVNLR